MCLTEDEIKRLYMAGMVDYFRNAVVKRAAAPAAVATATSPGVLSKIRDVLKFSGAATSHSVSTAKKVIGSVPALAMGGILTGALGATGYNVLKDSLSELSPEEELSAKIEAMYSNRTKELEDAKWMDRVRSMRDELRRNYKKMSSDEYREKYDALVAALDERRA